MTLLDPQIERILLQVKKAAYPEFWQLTPAQARAQYEKTAPVLDARPIGLYEVDNLDIPGPHGPIPVRVYTPRPPQAGERLPLLVWLHGGGFVVGSLNSYDALCRQLARRADCIVVAVDYRLAPEHKFPCAVDDSFAALNWVAAHADPLHADPTRLAIGGDSAGGTLAAACTLLARDHGGPALCFQLLVYPGVAAKPDSASHHEFAEGYILSRHSILWFFNHYLRDERDCYDPRFAPLVAEDLSRLPPALLIVAGFDPLRDDELAYYRRLQEAGNQVELAYYAGMVHAFFSFSGAVDAAREAVDRAAGALRRAFGSSE